MRRGGTVVKSTRIGRWMTGALAALVLAVSATNAEAGQISLGNGPVTFTATGTSSSGYTVSATATFSVDDANDTLTLVLENTTPFTRSAAELLTAFEFDFVSLSGTSSLASAVTTTQRYVAGDGSVTDSNASSDVDLLGQNTWQLSQNSGPHRIQFNPDAEYAIIGDVESGVGDYSNANGGIRNNNGHNPFAFGPTTFVFDLPSFSGAPDLSEMTFYFGTSLETSIRVVPLPPAAWMGLGMLGVLGVVRLRRRRRNA